MFDNNIDDDLEISDSFAKCIESIKMALERIDEQDKKIKEIPVSSNYLVEGYEVYKKYTTTGPIKFFKNTERERICKYYDLFVGKYRYDINDMKRHEMIISNTSENMKQLIEFVEKNEDIGVMNAFPIQYIFFYNR